MADVMALGREMHQALDDLVETAKSLDPNSGNALGHIMDLSQKSPIVDARNTQIMKTANAEANASKEASRAQ